MLTEPAPGDVYLLDAGKILTVRAVNPRDAAASAGLQVIDHDSGSILVPAYVANDPKVYQIDADGKIMAVFERDHDSLDFRPMEKTQAQRNSALHGRAGIQGPGSRRESRTRH